MANVTLSPIACDILGRSTCRGNLLYLPPERLDRKTYDAVNKALMAAGGKWSTKAQAHIFDGDPRPKLGLMLKTGVAVDEKKKYQAFFTPPVLAAKVAGMADVDGRTVLEPSAGRGSLADACLAAGAERVECVELNPDSAAKLRVKGYPTVEGDFLALTPKSYTRIVMNPPFAKDQDVNHVAHALRFLVTGGVLVAIMLANTSRLRFAALVSGLDYDIEEVPAGAFQESGTPIATIILRVRSSDNSAPSRAATGDVWKW